MIEGDTLDHRQWERVVTSEGIIVFQLTETIQQHYRAMTGLGAVSVGGNVDIKL